MANDVPLFECPSERPLESAVGSGVDSESESLAVESSAVESSAVESSAVESELDSALACARRAVGRVVGCARLVGPLTDADLLRVQRELSDLTRELGASAAVVAGEIGHRSRRELGFAGLAQREGFRTPEALVRHETGSTARTASALVQAGAMTRDATDTKGTSGAQPWFREVGAAIASGSLSVEAAQAIRVGLGAPSEAVGAVTPDNLARAAHILVLEAALVDADELLRRARTLRDDLDAAGIADRERVAFEERSVRRIRRPNGLSRYIIDPDIESAAFWDDVYDTITSPRRGGVRFVDAADKAWADAISSDQRTTDQYVHDSFTQLLRIAVSAENSESRRIVGSRQPSVRVLVTKTDLEAGKGHGRIEGCDIPISLETVERLACESGTVQLDFDESGRPLDLGREQRLYSKRQRIALAAAQGGCMFGNCDRPPSWCEAHHSKHWKRDHGETNIWDGVLLCRYHHLLVHNNGWEIVRDDTGFWLIPPPEVDPEQRPRLMPSKSAALRDLRRFTA